MRQKLRSARLASPNATAPQGRRGLSLKQNLYPRLAQCCYGRGGSKVEMSGARRHGQRSSAGQTSLSSSVRPDGQMETADLKCRPPGSSLVRAKAKG